jgi:hypothetical protein
MVNGFVSQDTKLSTKQNNTSNSYSIELKNKIISAQILFKKVSLKNIKNLRNVGRM